mgnify:CR=1 FL=1
MTSLIISRTIACIVLLSSFIGYSQSSLQSASKTKTDTTKVAPEERLNPWQQASGEVLLSPYVSSYTATSYRTDRGERVSFADNGKYSNYNPRLFIAAPLFGEHVNVVASVPYFSAQFEDENSTSSNADFGDIEVGLKFHIAKLKNNYLMASITSYFPAYTNTSTPFVGYDLFALESRLIFSGTSTWLGEYNNFHKIEVGLRYFFPEDPIQFRFLLSEGYDITPKVKVLGEVEGMFSNSGREAFFENNLQAVADFSVVKASFNLGYEFSDTFSWYVGVFHDVYNNNAAIGYGFQTFAVLRLR